MRPVSIPENPPAGTYDEQALLNYEFKITKTTKGSNKQQKILKPREQIIADVEALVDEWIAQGCKMKSGSLQFENSSDKKDYDENMKLLSRGSGWGAARRALIERIGAYCSYCESPIFSHLHIEHRLPKSTFPGQMFAWTNFLLACSPCNSAKGNEPSQATVPHPPASTASAANYIINESEIHYLWPDKPWIAGTAQVPFPFKYQLAWVSKLGKNPSFEEMSRCDRDKLQDLFEKGGLGEDAGVYYMPFRTHGKRHFAVQILRCPAKKLSNSTKDAAGRIIRLTSLGTFVEAKDRSKSVDRRMINRTTAWFRAVAVRKRLADALVLDKQRQDLYPAVIAQARVTIRNTGFWGVWLQVLGARITPPTDSVQTQEFLKECFAGTSPVRWKV